MTRKPYKTHYVGEPRTITLCGLSRVQEGKAGKKMLPCTVPKSSKYATCQNCLNLYYGPPAIQAWHAAPPIAGVPF